MGLLQAKEGVKLDFLDTTGTRPIREPVQGQFAFFFAIPRAEGKGNFDPIYGSQDWLTDIIVVDNPAKLIDMPPTQRSMELSSAGSKHVLVQWSVAKDEGKAESCLTISTGEQASRKDYLFVDNVLVLPKETVMNPDHKLFHLWTQAALRFAPYAF